jgi:NF-X1-type zinc finger protein NFXL1
LTSTKKYIPKISYSNVEAKQISLDLIFIKIWNCEGCFAQFHLFCIQNWIKDGSYLLQANTDNTSDKPKEIPWNCPKCRKEYKQSQYPSKYQCYCKKVLNPKFDPWSIPHSCNQVCEKNKLCGHKCLTICHPGPCPPCPKMVMSSCFCSKSQPVSRRCANKLWSCNKVCNKLLPCKQHLCEKICHNVC